MDTGIDNDRQILAAWQAAYGRFWGEGPTFGDLPDGGTDITFPAIPDPYGLSKIMIGSITVFADKPVIAEHLKRVGFGANADGLMTTCPSPSSFLAGVARAGFPGCGFKPHLTALDQPDLLLGSWFGAMCEGLVLINVGTQSFYDRYVPEGKPELFTLKPNVRLSPKDIAKHFMYVQHDMTKHAILLHLVPRTCIQQYGDRIKEAFPEKYTKWVSDPKFMPHVASPITRFYENDLVVYCDRIYDHVRRPEDFVATYLAEENHKQLLEQLEQKIALSLDPETEQSLKVGYRPPSYRIHQIKAQGYLGASAAAG